MKKIKKDLWEEIFLYPSFNTRFSSVLVFVLLGFFIFTSLLLFSIKLVAAVPDQIALLNLMVQSATLVLGIFAAYYALRQLVESRFTNLDEVAMREMKQGRYARAFEKWKEAFYIRPEVSVFKNMCEAILLMGDFEAFDEYISLSQRKSFLNKKMFEEVSDRVALLYLKAMRHLLVKNQGEAEKNISELVILATQENALSSFNWDFLDLQRSPMFLNLSGECRTIAENLIIYLEKSMTPTRKVDFEAKNYASQVA